MSHSNAEKMRWFLTHRAWRQL